MANTNTRTLGQMFSQLELVFIRLDGATHVFSRDTNGPNRRAVRDAIQNFQQSLIDNADVAEGFLACYSCKLLAMHLLFCDRQLRGDVVRQDINRLFETFHIDKSSNITKIFNETIRGITYFQDEINFLITNKPVPLYHRTTCCGPRDGPILNVERCYIERKIYDEIHKMFTVHFPKAFDDTDYFEPLQNRCHIDFLTVMTHLYKTTFPDMDDIHIKVNKDVDFHIPLTVTIKRQYKNGQMTEDTYTKTYKVNRLNNQLYEDEVRCTRKDSSGGSVKIYEKSQSFEHETAWRELATGGRKANKAKRQ